MRALAFVLSAAALACASAPRPPPAEQLALRQRAAGETARRYHDPATAATLYGHASTSAAAGDRPALAADAAYRQGLALLSSGAAAEALGPLERAAAEARALGDPGLAARALLGLARARRSAGRADVATPLTVARALAEEAGDRVAAALAEVGLGALSGSAGEARAHYAAAAGLAGDAPEVAGPLQLNRARLAEREGNAAEALAAYRQALGPLALGDDRAGLLAALAGAARLAGAEPAGRAEAAALHRRAAAVAAGLGRLEVERAEREAAARLDEGPPGR